MTGFNRCPACGYQADAVMDVKTAQDYAPTPGDVGICFGCGSKQVIDKDLHLALLGYEEEKSMDVETQIVLDRIQQQWYATHQERNHTLPRDKP